MIPVHIPPCIFCKHRERTDAKCGAYPNGIPDDIWEERIDPRTLPECGNGYKFEDDRMNESTT